MSDVSPSDDARCMLFGLRTTIQGQFPMKTPDPCEGEESILVVMDNESNKIVWTSSVATALVIVLVHLTRWLSAINGRNATGEFLVCMFAIIGTMFFLWDVYNCKMQTGMCKLVGCLIIANCILPWLMYYDDTPDDEFIEEDA